MRPEHKKIGRLGTKRLARQAAHSSLLDLLHLPTWFKYYGKKDVWRETLQPVLLGTTTILLEDEHLVDGRIYSVQIFLHEWVPQDTYWDRAAPPVREYLARVHGRRPDPLEMLGFIKTQPSKPRLKRPRSNAARPKNEPQL